MIKQSACLLILIVAFSVEKASAQWKGFSFGPYLEFAWPKGDLDQRNTNGVGVGITANIKVNRQWSATGSFGYMRFGGQGRFPENYSPALSTAPVRLGLKYKLPLVYLKLETGTARYINNSSGAMILSPGIGMRILGLDVQGSYESWLGEESLSFTSLKLAYHF